MAIGSIDNYICNLVTDFNALMVITVLDAFKTIFCSSLDCISFENTSFFLKLQKDQNTCSSNYMRIWNEGASLLLFAIVFLIILKDTLHWIAGVLGIVGLALVLLLGIRLYKKTRKDK
jgi:putative membrane protein